TLRLSCAPQALIALLPICALLFVLITRVNGLTPKPTERLSIIYCQILPFYSRHTHKLFFFICCRNGNERQSALILTGWKARGPDQSSPCSAFPLLNFLLPNHASLN